jgi:hypothetical protein
MLNRAQQEAKIGGVHERRLNFVRYAIFYTPQPGTAFAAFGRSWFGRTNDGATLQAFSSTGLTAGLARVPTAASRYSGLHAVFRAAVCAA